MSDLSEPSADQASFIPDPKIHSSVSQSANPQRLVLMGTGPFAVPAFDALRQAGHDIPLVITRPMPAIKSRKGLPPSPVRDWACSHDLPLFDPDNINDEESVANVKEQSASLLVVCDYGQILKTPALQAASLGGINLHGSILPKYRGAAPVQWALLNGETITGVSVIHMTPRLDGGPIISCKKTPIRNDETAGELEDRLALLGVEATIEAVERLATWDGVSPLGQPQEPSEVTKAPRLRKVDAEIDWGRSADELDFHIRGMQPWPIAFTYFQPPNKKQPMRLAIKEISITDTASQDHQPGEIVPGDSFLIATGDRLVEIKRLQPSGKREMQGIEFLRGHNPPAGSCLFAQ